MIREMFPPPEVEAGETTVTEYRQFTGFQEAPLEEDDPNDGMPVLRGDNE